MNGTSNSTALDNDDGLTGGSLFLVILSATSAWCIFIMCVVCCSEYRGYQRRGKNRSYERTRKENVEAKSYVDRKDQLSTGVAVSVNVQQEMSTMSHSEEPTNSSVERKEEQSDIFDDQNDTLGNERSIDFPTPRTKKNILPPINVGSLISVEKKCHAETSSPSKEMLINEDKKSKQSEMTPVHF